MSVRFGDMGNVKDHADNRKLDMNMGNVNWMLCYEGLMVENVIVKIDISVMCIEQIIRFLFWCIIVYEYAIKKY